MSELPSGTRQAARNALFASALQCPAPRDYPTHAAYLKAFEAYQTATMQPLRDALSNAPERKP